MTHYLQYSETELNHLRSRDKRMAEAIDRIGMIQRAANPDLFASLIDAIVGQQISTKAHVTISRRMLDSLGEITPTSIATCSLERLQSFGMSFKKVEYMQGIAQKVVQGELNIDELRQMSDEEVCASLSKLNGVGVWTAEMLMTFSMQRPNIISYGDLAILRGMRMLYRHRKITKELFRKYQRRYSPYATTASLYLWAIAGGAIEGLTDPAPKAKTK